jgi:hypothetical protein
MKILGLAAMSAALALPVMAQANEWPAKECTVTVNREGHVTISTCFNPRIGGEGHEVHVVIPAQP